MKRIHVTVTDTQYSAAKMMADDDGGLSFSAWTRKLIAEEMKRRSIEAMQIAQ